MSVILDGIWPLCDHGYVSGGCAECRESEPEPECAVAPEEVVDLRDHFSIGGFYPARYGL